MSICCAPASSFIAVGVVRSHLKYTLVGVVQSLRHPISGGNVAIDLASRLQTETITDIVYPILGCRGHRASLLRVVQPDFRDAFAAKGVQHSLTIAWEHEATIYKHICEQFAWKRWTSASQPSLWNCGRAQPDTASTFTSHLFWSHRAQAQGP